jgi:hypothetical protein
MTTEREEPRVPPEDAERAVRAWAKDSLLLLHPDEHDHVIDSMSRFVADYAAEREAAAVEAYKAEQRELEATYDRIRDE